MGAFESKGAFAQVLCSLVDACGIIAARRCSAMVHHMLAHRTVESGSTLAFESVDLVLACCAVEAWSTGAFVDIHIAYWSRPSRLADALLRVQRINAEPIDARIQRTQILFLVAAFAAESRRTITVEVVDQISASRIKCARIVSTIVDIDLARRSSPTGQAFALESPKL